MTKKKHSKFAHLHLKCTIQDITFNVWEGNKSSGKLNAIYFKRKTDIYCLKTHSQIKQQKAKAKKNFLEQVFRTWIFMSN